MTAICQLLCNMTKIHNVYCYSTTWSLYLLKTLCKVIVWSKKGHSKLDKFSFGSYNNSSKWPLFQNWSILILGLQWYIVCPLQDSKGSVKMSCQAAHDIWNNYCNFHGEVSLTRHQISNWPNIRCAACLFLSLFWTK